MALVPVILRPGFILRRNAMRKGLLGPSVLWKVVAAFVFGRSTMKKLFGKSPEPLGRRVIGAGSVITIAAAAPISRRQAKRAGITKASLEADSRGQLEAAQRAS